MEIPITNNKSPTSLASERSGRSVVVSHTFRDIHTCRENHSSKLLVNRLRVRVTSVCSSGD